MQLNNNDQLPIVTIMIPTYMQEDLILKAVNSAREQDYPNLEIVIADDASPDGTINKILSLNDSRILYCKNEFNLGRVANYRNALYNLASGAWVLNLDGDDYLIDPHFISAAIELVQADDTIVIVTAKQLTITNTETYVNKIPQKKLLNGIDIISKLPNESYSFAHLATIYNRTLALERKFYGTDVLSSDLDSLFRLALEGKVAYLDKIVGIWVKKGNNASSNNSVDENIANLAIWPSIIKAAQKKGLHPIKSYLILKRTLSYNVYGYLINCICNKNYKMFYDYTIKVILKYGCLIYLLSIVELFTKGLFKSVKKICVRKTGLRSK